MSQEELIADTNRMLRQLLEIDARQREEAEKFKKEHEEEMAKMDLRHKASMTDRLKEMGLPAEATEDTNIDWEARRKQVHERTQANIELARQKDEEYKTTLLGELKTQSDLLRQILERLEP